MTEDQTIDGKIIQVSPWKSGKGCFVKLDTLEADFFKFGGFGAKVGDVVRIAYKPGTNNYSDKFEIVRTEELNKFSDQDPTGTPKTGFTPANNIPKSKPAGTDIADTIRRSVTIKCASNLWAATLKDGDRTSIPELIPKIIQTAKELETYIEKG